MKSQHINEMVPPEVPEGQKKFFPSVLKRLGEYEQEAERFADGQERLHGVYREIDDTNRVLNENDRLRYKGHAFAAWTASTLKARTSIDLIVQTYADAQAEEARTEKKQKEGVQLARYVTEVITYVGIFESHLNDLEAESNATQKVAELIRSGMQLHAGDGTFSKVSAEQMKTAFTNSDYKFVLPPNFQAVQGRLREVKNNAKSIGRWPWI